MYGDGKYIVVRFWGVGYLARYMRLGGIYIEGSDVFWYTIL
jgi:hypothetical protein